jgi:hypothetical protein
MKLLKTTTSILSAVSATILLSVLTPGKAQALSEISLPERFVIENSHNRSMVVDKFGDNPNSADKAHLYSKADTRTHTLRGVRSSNGSYEVKSVFNGNLCFTMAGGLNPYQGNGTLAIFSNDCNNSLNLRFFDDGTVRVARNTNLCLTNQGNRHSTLFNKLHWWGCDNSPETKWNISAANSQSVVYNPPVVSRQYNPPMRSNIQPQNISNVANFKYSKNGLKVGVAFVDSIFDTLIQMVKETYEKKRVRVLTVIPNSQKESWDAVAKKCDKADFWDYDGYHDYFLIWLWDKESNQAHKTCVVYE